MSNEKASSKILIYTFNIYALRYQNIYAVYNLAYSGFVNDKPMIQQKLVLGGKSQSSVKQSLVKENRSDGNNIDSFRYIQVDLILVRYP